MFVHPVKSIPGIDNPVLERINPVIPCLTSNMISSDIKGHQLNVKGTYTVSKK